MENMDQKNNNSKAINTSATVHGFKEKEILYKPVFPVIKNLKDIENTYNYFTEEFEKKIKISKSVFDDFISFKAGSYKEPAGKNDEERHFIGILRELEGIKFSKEDGRLLARLFHRIPFKKQKKAEDILENMNDLKSFKACFAHINPRRIVHPLIVKDQIIWCKKTGPLKESSVISETEVLYNNYSSFSKECFYDFGTTLIFYLPFSSDFKSKEKKRSNFHCL